ncbi:YCF48-related protein [Schlesneria sp. T3-172]|uniref:YCF48-related protein n=1 Tax=Schlesneria sphaerica TaxID=3373610 RepID=UPI0037C81B80
MQGSLPRFKAKSLCASGTRRWRSAHAEGCLPCSGTGEGERSIEHSAGWVLRLWLVPLLAICGLCDAAEIPPPWVDDAQLHDVRIVGTQFAMAVGEHGAIWKSSDGGRTWTAAHLGQNVSLRSLCFFDDQTGWIAGHQQSAYSGTEKGVVLSTQDGGATWQPLDCEQLPGLNYVRFFGMDDGIVVGRPTQQSPTGIYKTSDGGKTWRGVQGEAPHSWKAMCFLEPEMGLVGGAEGRVNIMGGEQLFPSKLQPQGFRSVRAITLAADNVGWLAGDGGLVLKTTTEGVAWEVPEGSLPEEMRDVMDFRAVEVRGQNVWLAGSPGSAVWHSSDGGREWKKQLTGHTAPLSAIRFTKDQLGVAVGAFGVILRTEDGGQSWQSVRGGGRRAAVLSVHARPGGTSPALLTKLSGEQGYRSAVWIAQRDDLGPMALMTESESVLRSAVQLCGGNAADVHWQLPLTLPGIEFSAQQLLAEWQKQTEGRLPQTLMGTIVRQIRTWRPNILVVDQPPADDAVGQLLFNATLKAVKLAADTNRYQEQTEVTGLESWRVDRVYMRLAPGASGDAHVELDEFLPHLKSSTRTAAGPAISLLQGERAPSIDTVEAPRIAYRWIGLDGKPADGTSVRGVTSRDFFVGLSLTPGSAGRRDSSPLDEENLERNQKLVQKQRNYTGLFQRSLDDPRVANQLIGQLNGIVDGMAPEQGVGLLRDLANEYRKRSQFELVESTYVELIRRYPNEPGSLDAMRWLLQFWSSSETAWQRTQAMKSGSSVAQSNPLRGSVIQQVGAQVDDGTQRTRNANLVDGSLDAVTQSNIGSPIRLNTKLDLDATHSRDNKSTQPGRLKIDPDVDWRTGAVAEWRSRAGALAKKLQTASPTLYGSPEIQFPLAALRRSEGTVRAGDAIMRNFVTNAINPEIRQLAERDLWASFATPETPTWLAHCERVLERPVLDGLLSDPCWVEAQEIFLTESPTAGDDVEETGARRRSMMMLAYDTQFLFIALRVPREAAAPQDRPQTNGRYHDADLSRHDRVSVRLDIDRDYSTWYEFQIDQRGWTAESCWEDRNWNPTWYVAAEMDETDWRIEAAIPWKDLSPTPPQRSTIYGLSVLRTTPSVGLQSWTQPATARIQPSSFGLLKFE